MTAPAREMGWRTRAGLCLLGLLLFMGGLLVLYVDTYRGAPGLDVVGGLLAFVGGALAVAFRREGFGKQPRVQKV